MKFALHRALPIALLAASGFSHATLLNRGGGMIYDTDLNITWLQNWNYAKSSGYDADGLMSWDRAMTWASNLNFGGYSDWRLPTKYIPDFLTCIGLGCSGELAHLWNTELGNPGTSLNVDYRNWGEFQNLYQFDSPLRYWTATEVEWNSAMAYEFQLLGVSGIIDKPSDRGAIAVRNGDVMSTVPEPQSFVLVLLALGFAASALRGCRK